MSCGMSFGRLLSGRMQNACAIAYAATLGDDDDAHSGPQKCTAPSLHQTTHPFPHPLPQLPKLILGMMSIGLTTVTINIEVRGCGGLSSLIANWFASPIASLVCVLVGTFLRTGGFHIESSKKRLTRCTFPCMSKDLALFLSHIELR